MAGGTPAGPSRVEGSAGLANIRLVAGGIQGQDSFVGINRRLNLTPSFINLTRQPVEFSPPGRISFHGFEKGEGLLFHAEKILDSGLVKTQPWIIRFFSESLFIEGENGVRVSFLQVELLQSDEMQRLSSPFPSFPEIFDPLLLATLGDLSLRQPYSRRSKGWIDLESSPKSPPGPFGLSLTVKE